MLCVIVLLYLVVSFFFFNDTATTEIYTLSLHDALPICFRDAPARLHRLRPATTPRSCRRDGLNRGRPRRRPSRCLGDRKSTRLNSSHVEISYAVFCLKKKKNSKINIRLP